MEIGLIVVATYLSIFCNILFGSPALVRASFLMSEYSALLIGQHSALWTTLPSMDNLSPSPGVEVQENTPSVWAAIEETLNLCSWKYKFYFLWFSLKLLILTFGICLEVELFLMSSNLSFSDSPATSAQTASASVKFTSGFAPFVFLIFSFPTSVLGAAFSHLPLMYLGTWEAKI